MTVSYQLFHILRKEFWLWQLLYSSYLDRIMIISSLSKYYLNNDLVISFFKKKLLLSKKYQRKNIRIIACLLFLLGQKKSGSINYLVFSSVQHPESDLSSNVLISTVTKLEKWDKVGYLLHSFFMHVIRRLAIFKFTSLQPLNISKFQFGHHFHKILSCYTV